MAESTSHFFYKRILYEHVEKFLQKKSICLKDLDKDYEVYMELQEQGLYTKRYPSKNLNGYIPDFFFSSFRNKILYLGEAKIMSDFNRDKKLLNGNISQIKKGFKFIFEKNYKDIDHIFFFSVPLRYRMSVLNTFEKVLFEFKFKYKSSPSLKIIVI